MPQTGLQKIPLRHNYKSTQALRGVQAWEQLALTGKLDGWGFCGKRSASVLGSLGEAS